MIKKEKSIILYTSDKREYLSGGALLMGIVSMQKRVEKASQFVLKDQNLAEYYIGEMYELPFVHVFDNNKKKSRDLCKCIAKDLYISEEKMLDMDLGDVVKRIYNYDKNIHNYLVLGEIYNCLSFMPFNYYVEDKPGTEIIEYKDQYLYVVGSFLRLQLKAYLCAIDRMKYKYLGIRSNDHMQVYRRFRFQFNGGTQTPVTDETTVGKMIREAYINLPEVDFKNDSINSDLYKNKKAMLDIINNIIIEPLRLYADVIDIKKPKFYR